MLSCGIVGTGFGLELGALGDGKEAGLKEDLGINRGSRVSSDWPWLLWSTGTMMAWALAASCGCSGIHTWA